MRLAWPITLSEKFYEMVTLKVVSISSARQNRGWCGYAFDDFQTQTTWKYGENGKLIIHDRPSKIGPYDIVKEIAP